MGWVRVVIFLIGVGQRNK